MGKINKLTNLYLEKEKKKSQITKIRNLGEDITTDFTGVKNSIREYYEQLYANNLDNLDEMDIFIETHKVP